MTVYRSLNEYRDKAYNYAKSNGFHDEEHSLATRLMLTVSELSEVLESDRKNNWTKEAIHYNEGFSDESYKKWFEENVKDTVEDEIADALIRLFDIAGKYNIDLDFHVIAKMKYNEMRPYKHGKKY